MNNWINWQKEYDLKITKIRAYARASYRWDIDIFSRGVESKMKALFEDGGKGRVIKIDFSGRTTIDLDARFAVWNNNITLDASARANLEISVGERRCNPWCNDVSFCWRGARARMCMGIGANVRYNRGFSVDIGRR